MVGRISAVILSLSVVGIGLASCSASSSSTLPTAPAITAAAPFTASGSIDQANETGAKPGQSLMLADSGGHIVARGTTDSLGSLVIFNLTPGSGFTFRSVAGSTVYGTKPFDVLSTSYLPPQSLYTNQHLSDGLNYITMRDGISINATVRLPLGKTLADGPFPTVIEYSGYQTAAPGNLLKAMTSGTDPSKNPLNPSTATAVGAVLAPLLGFAVVSVQMRGSGCSGGVFDLFGLTTSYDGYDLVETVAHQSWVSNHKVGMVGISFSGISQMFVGGTRPPDLAALAPLSTTNDLYDTGYPGGMFNDGFAASWITERFDAAQPAPGANTLPYANALIANGDKQCMANQILHGQVNNLQKEMAQATYRVPALYDPRSPQAWAKKIDVPVFIVGAFQDEQTGGQWASMIQSLKNDKDAFATVINGTHVDSLNPDIFTRWLEFLDIFVAGQVPSTPPVLPVLDSQLYQGFAGAPGAPFPPIRFTDAQSVSQAKQLFEQNDPRVRVLFDNGGAASSPGSLGSEWEQDFAAWPAPQAVVTHEYLGSSGALSTTVPSPSSVSFRPDPSARPPNDLPKGNAWSALPPYAWTPITGSIGVGFISPPLTRDVVVAGPAALDIYVQSSASDTDLQATVSEVRPDGSEMYISSGDLRASDRKLDTADSTALHPVPTYLASDSSPLPKGRFAEVQIPITPFAYAFRAGSQIRVTIEGPGGDRPAWAFYSPPTNGTVLDTVSLGGTQASSLVLAVIPNTSAPDAQPACPSLRGQPCRTYAPAGNSG